MLLSLVKLVERLLIHNLHSLCHVDKTMDYPTAGIADRELLLWQFWEQQREVWICERVIVALAVRMGTSASPVSAEFQVLLRTHSLVVTLYDSRRRLCFCLLIAFICFLSLCSVPSIYIHLYVHWVIFLSFWQLIIQK